MKTQTETQCSRILTILKDNEGNWLPSYIFAKTHGILQYNARIFSLRRKYKDLYIIENTVKRHGTQRHGFFRLIKR